MKVYRKLTLRDRYQIKIGIDNRERPSKIAVRIERDRSVVSREIATNGEVLWYDPYKAQERSRASFKKGFSKISHNPNLRSYVTQKVKEGWSGTVIAGRWNLDKGKGITAETVYKWLYSGDGAKEKLYEFLPRHKKKREMLIRKNKQNDETKVSIKERPDEINNRQLYGHWEADLVFQIG